AEPKVGKAAGEMSTLRAPYGCASCTSSVSADTGLQIERGNRDHEVPVEIDRPEKIERSNRGGGQMRCGPLSLRSEEHTSELQSLAYLVCRLLLEKKKKKQN